MPWISLGIVTVASSGTPVQATSNMASDAPYVGARERWPCMAIMFQAQNNPGRTNTGKTYVGNRADFNRITGDGLLAQLAIPTANTIPSSSASIPYAVAALNASDYWVDADASGDGVLVSILV